jgi:hypothetical protein
MFAALVVQSLSSCTTYYSTSDLTLSLSSLTFSGCSSTAVQVSYAYCVASITNSQFSYCGNSAADGGGISFSGLELVASRCSFDHGHGEDGSSVYASASSVQPAHEWNFSDLLATHGSCTRNTIYCYSGRPSAPICCSVRSILRTTRRRYGRRRSLLNPGVLLWWVSATSKGTVPTIV